MEISTKRILFFDGVCKLCHGLVNWAIPRFKPGAIYFSPLQGSAALKMLPLQDLNLESVVYLRDGLIHRKSTAVLWLIFDSDMFLLKPMIMLRFLPVRLRDLVYDLVARTRYQVFGKTESCKIPNPAERPFFLD